MRLYLTNGNKQNAYNKWIPGGIPYVSWKNDTYGIPPGIHLLYAI